VLMDPFKDIVQEQVKRHPLDTLLAWIGPETRADREISMSEADFFSNPIRAFLWRYSPSAEDCKTIWSVHGEVVLKSMERGKIALPAMLLLYSHPVLLAKVICEILAIHLATEEAAVPIIMKSNLFRRVPDPQKNLRHRVQIPVAFRDHTRFCRTQRRCIHSRPQDAGHASSDVPIRT